MRIAAGVDVGSTQTKAVLLGDNGERTILARALVDTGANVRKAAENAFDQCCQIAGIPQSEVGFVVGTGYGRYKISFGNAQMTEISCHARGAHFLCPGTRTVIDMGGQDAKAISVGPSGEVLDFVMNDKCAAGTGRFFEVMADVLEVPIEEFGPEALKSQNPCHVSSTCTIFAESEIVSHRAEGRSREDLLAGIAKAVASRVVVMGKSVGFRKAIIFTGGVAKNVGVKRALENEIGMEIIVPKEPQIMGALGAAIIAKAEAAKLAS
jgi:predicted CoA-substrate-specific enzyme activase